MLKIKPTGRHMSQVGAMALANKLERLLAETPPTDLANPAMRQVALVQAYDLMKWGSVPDGLDFEFRLVQEAAEPPDGPSAETLRAFIAKHYESAAEAGREVGIKSRTMRRYCADAGLPGARTMPWSAWALLRILSNAATPAEIRKEAAARAMADDDGKGRD